VAGLDGVLDLALGEAYACALVESGAVRCWGRNSEGQLGDGTTDESREPVAAADLVGVRDLAAGWYHTCALLEDGTVRCWGDNSEGQLGDGTTDDSCPTWTCPLEPWDPSQPGQRSPESEAWCERCASPITVPGLEGLVGIEAASSRTCAVRGDGSIACWGSGAGQPVTSPSTATVAVGDYVGAQEAALLSGLEEQHSCRGSGRRHGAMSPRWARSSSRTRRRGTTLPPGAAVDYTVSLGPEP
jgi:hypothetical protein